MEPSFYTALLIGFFGSTHCIGMCGGIVGALSASHQQSGRQSQFSAVAYLTTYNVGRILSYIFAGALAGLLGAQATGIFADQALPIGRLIASVVMIVLGLYVAGWWRIIEVIERAGLHLWRLIEPLGRHFIPARTPLHAFGLGLVWGWLPCGLVYSALALSTVSASPREGAAIMLGFGLGTLPMLLAMGSVVEQLRKIVQRPAVGQVAGVSIILFGVYTGLSALSWG